MAISLPVVEGASVSTGRGHFSAGVHVLCAPDGRLCEYLFYSASVCLILFGMNLVHLKSIEVSVCTLHTHYIASVLALQH